MSEPEDPTPITGQQLGALTGVERVLARSDRHHAAAPSDDAPAPPAALSDAHHQALVRRLTRLEDDAAQIRRELGAQGARLALVEPRVTLLEAAVARIDLALAALARHLDRLDARVVGMSGLTVLGGAVANVVMHKLGWM